MRDHREQSSAMPAMPVPPLPSGRDGPGRRPDGGGEGDPVPEDLGEEEATASGLGAEKSGEE